MNNTKNVWTAVAIVAFVVVGYLLWGGETKAPEENIESASEAVATSTENKSVIKTTKVKNTPYLPTTITIPGGIKAYVVNYTSEGFSPATLTIKVGESVRFVNLSQNAFWVASDPHPQHNAYSEFDQGKTVGYKGTYDFTFNQKGTWGYHNHMSFSKKGTILVE